MAHKGLEPGYQVTWSVLLSSFTEAVKIRIRHGQHERSEGDASKEGHEGHKGNEYDASKEAYAYSEGYEEACEIPRGRILRWSLD